MLELSQISRSTFPLVGDKVLYLSQLARAGLPVVPTQVIDSTLWHQMLRVVWGSNRLSALTPGILPAITQRLREAIHSYPLAFDWSSATQLSRPLILRTSLAFDQSSEELPDSFHSQDWLGLIPAQICSPTNEDCAHALRALWRESLSALNLMVWNHHCAALKQLHLSLLVHPVSQAQMSGVLTMTGSCAQIEVVKGLGLALSRGEAVPARCHWEPPTPPRWLPGFQERQYGLNEEGRLCWRQQPASLSTTLKLEQLKSLMEVGRQAQGVMGAAIRLEWLIDDASGSLLITQAAPKHVHQTRRLPEKTFPTKLEAPCFENGIGLVIQGIPAAAGKVSAPALVLSSIQDLTISLPSGRILVAQELQPDVFARMSAIKGIITEQGGATSHAAILARELGIPAVVGAPQATQLIQSQENLWMDGDRGLIYSIPGPAIPTSPSSPSKPTLQRTQSTQTQVMVNLSLASFRDGLDASDGVGLLRSEWLLLQVLEGRHPQDWIDTGQAADLSDLLVRHLQPILEFCGSKPVRYRSLDLRSHEWVNLIGSPPIETNPMLGLRGTFSYRLDDRLFRLELQTLAKLQRLGHRNLELILPFVRTVEEFTACHQLIEQAGLRKVQEFKVWIMAEVPSVLFLLPAYVQAGVQGIAIGTNDLTQLLLAIDREQPAMASAFNECHPAVMAALAHLVKTAQILDIPCSLCGQAPVRFPELIETLVAWGLESISVEPSAIIKTREAVFQAELQARKNRSEPI